MCREKRIETRIAYDKDLISVSIQHILCQLSEAKCRWLERRCSVSDVATSVWTRHSLSLLCLNLIVCKNWGYKP